jgi:formylglycine-generating enzyme required for sulfatase activity
MMRGEGAGDATLADPAPSGPDIFLSYAREDEARAGELAMALDQQGFSVFWDRDVPPGQTWHSYIARALAGARCVVVAWSRHSVTSQWVIEEASEGKDRDALIPVLFDAVQPPFGFRAIQAASLVDWRPGRPSPAFEGLLEAVRRIVGERTRSGMKSAIPEQRSPQPARPPPRQIRKRFYRSVAVIVAGLIAIGGVGIYRWRMQPGPRQAPELPGPLSEAQVPTKPGPSAAAKPVPPPAAPAPRETHEPGDEIRDCEQCPVLAWVPAGEFTMGSPPNEGRRSDREGPQHRVTIAHALAVGKTEVTFAQWDACVAAGGCNHKPDDHGWGHGDQPVINVSWNDAQDYVKWLKEETGKGYRLLTEAEWEYVARAGSTTAYWWGDEVGRGNANCHGCGSQWDGQQNAPVGRFAANRFGLYDTGGNVWEWVEDCWHDTYNGAPEDGSAWKNGGLCSDRVTRGGACASDPSCVRSAFRDFGGADVRYKDGSTGFRVARTAD